MYEKKKYVCSVHIEQLTLVASGKNNGIRKESCRILCYSLYPEFT